ncbi:hypothetical protein [Rhodopseudomonas palustris]|uniref:Uncharacterized protein n=1 Tax=Rhodopseudomonas palustris (strain BisB18) TaxID=316056 RepID=Q212C8_RHOPB
MAQSSILQRRFRAWLSGNPDESVLRWLFRGTLAVTFAVLAADLATMNGWLNPADIALTPAEQREASPGLGLPAVPAILSPWLPGGNPRLAPMPQPDGVMNKPMRFELVNGGRLLATGSITPGVSEAFATEIAQHGEYIKTVVLNSPGGSVGDALAMGRLIREKKLATEVEAGKYCASSCPLMFVGGVERRAGSKAAIGVHQVFAMSQAATGAPRDEMSDAQRISARCQRYLGDMGINLQVWVHAMETPKDKLFVFTPEELKSLNVVTAQAGPAQAAVPPGASTAPAARAK